MRKRNLTPHQTTAYQRRYAPPKRRMSMASCLGEVSGSNGNYHNLVHVVELSTPPLRNRRHLPNLLRSRPVCSGQFGEHPLAFAHLSYKIN